MSCKHNFRRGEGDSWFCTKCDKRWISYKEGSDLYQQIHDLKKELVIYKQTFKLLKNRMNITLKESGIKTS